MDRTLHTELKLISKFLGYLQARDNPAERWRWLWRALSIFGWFLIAFCIFSAMQKDFGSLGFAIASALGGLLAGAGAVFQLSAQQWPIFSRFLDVKGLQDREAELKALLDK